VGFKNGKKKDYLIYITLEVVVCKRVFRFSQKCSFWPTTPRRR